MPLVADAPLHIQVAALLRFDEALCSRPVVVNTEVALARRVENDGKAGWLDRLVDVRCACARGGGCLFNIRLRGVRRCKRGRRLEEVLETLLCCELGDCLALDGVGEDQDHGVGGLELLDEVHNFLGGGEVDDDVGEED